MWRGIGTLCVMCTLGCGGGEGPAPAAPTVVGSEHYTLSLEDGLPPQEAQPILNRLEREHPRITASLGVDARHPIMVRVWRDREAFLVRMERDLGVRFPGAGGYVVGPTEACVLFQPQAAQVAVHECAHAQSLRLNPHFGNRPRWLWEAVALYEAEEFVDPRTLPYLVADQFPTLEALNQLPGPAGQQIYEVGWLLAAFIQDRWGSQAYRDLIHTQGDLPRVLGLNEATFHVDWKTWVKKKYLAATPEAKPCGTTC